MELRKIPNNQNESNKCSPHKVHLPWNVMDPLKPNNLKLEIYHVKESK